MKLDREEFLQTLDIAKLAIDSRDFIPILSHFCFHGDQVTAYNDFIGVKVKCKTNFRLALQANTLLRLINSVASQEIEIGESKKTVFFKSGHARTGVRGRLPFMQEADFYFRWPSKKRLPVCELSEQQAERFFLGVQMCLSSVGDQMPMQMGVTMNRVKSSLRMYSTNNRAISKYTMKALEVEGLENVILPTIFCEALLKGAAHYGLEKITLRVDRKFVLVEFGDECTMYGKLISNEEPLDFEKVISEHVTLAEYKRGRQKTPKDFASIFERALLMMSSDMLNNVVNVSLEQNTVSVEASSSLGKVKSSAVFKKNWPTKSFGLAADLAAKASAMAQYVYFGKGVVIFSKGTYMHLLSVHGE